MFFFLVLMERLVNELGSLLKMLDHETVSPATADKMASVRNILDSLPGTESCIRYIGWFIVHPKLKSHLFSTHPNANGGSGAIFHL